MMITTRADDRAASELLGLQLGSGQAAEGTLPEPWLPRSSSPAPIVAPLALTCAREPGFSPAESIRTGPLVLQRYRAADAPVVWEAIQQSRATLREWVPEVAGLRTLDEVAAGLAGLEQAWDQGRKLVYAVSRPHDGWFIGEVGLYALEWGRGAATIGIWLRDAAQGSGYGTRAFGALAGHALEVLGLPALEARIHPANARSRRLAERARFRLVGTSPAIPESEGLVREVLVYRLVAKDLASAPAVPI